MGDHRASIKIEVEFHGFKDSCDMWINYFPGSVEGVDDRIIEFFQNLYEQGMERFNKQMDKYWEKEREKEERDTYDRLKKKFDPTPEANKPV